MKHVEYRSGDSLEATLPTPFGADQGAASDAKAPGEHQRRPVTARHESQALFEGLVRVRDDRRLLEVTGVRTA